MDAEVVENRLTDKGMRWLHVVRMGAPVDAAAWLEQVCYYSRELVEHQVQHEQGLDLHHLRMWWPARELVTISGGANGLDGRQALLWKIDRGQSLRDAILYAGIAYLDETGRWPGVALVQAIPEGATERVMVYEDSDELHDVRLAVLESLPRGFILMCEEVTDER